MSDLARDLTVEEVADLLGMSDTWVRRQCRGDNPTPHLRYGHKIRFTPAQVVELRTRNERGGVESLPQPLTARQKRRP